jgi:hypothetical protein
MAYYRKEFIALVRQEAKAGMAAIDSRLRDNDDDLEIRTFLRGLRNIYDRVDKMHTVIEREGFDEDRKKGE